MAAKTVLKLPKVHRINQQYFLCGCYTEFDVNNEPSAKILLVKKMQANT
uniref:Uncharacterized protein n=1 Tax=Arundo donax TaxID=35708 RepID=A0A0A8Y9Y5_ARUDO